MTKIVVADTGPLIALALVKMLPILPRLFSLIYVPDGVVLEATQDPVKPGAQEIQRALEQGCIVRKSVEISGAYMDLIELLDQGEAEALALAEQIKAIALIDERRGRNIANKRGITVTGTAAVLIKAKNAGEITAIKPLLDELIQCGYRLSPSLVNNVLRLSDEL